MRDIDQIIERLLDEVPRVQIDQLQVSHPGDDDGLWFIKAPGSRGEVQIESSSGTCPFLIEADCTTERFMGHSVEEVVRVVQSLLEGCPAEGIRPPTA